MELLKSFMFGLNLGISIGPIALLIISYGLTYGKRTSVLSATGAALADMTFALIGFSFAYALQVVLEENHTVLKIASSAILLLFGTYMLYSAFRKYNKEAKSASKPEKPKNVLLSTYLLTIVNPLTILLFIGFSANMKTTTNTGIVLNSIALCCGSLLLNLALALAASYLRDFIRNKKTILILNMVSASGILLFALWSFI